MNLKPGSNISDQILRAIHSEPGHLIKHYATSLSLVPAVALAEVEFLIRQGLVVRNQNTERLSIPAHAAISLPAPILSTAAAVHAVEASSEAFEERVRALLQNGEMISAEIASALGMGVRDVAQAMRQLRDKGFGFDSEKRNEKIYWRLAIDRPADSPAELDSGDAAAAIRAEIAALVDKRRSPDWWPVAVRELGAAMGGSVQSMLHDIADHLEGSRQ